jgi:glycine/D-amino acid oxidase-like deaminating enzyme
MIFWALGAVWRLRPSEIDIQLLSQTHHLVSKHLLSYSGVETTGWINNGGLFLAHNHKRMQEYQRLHGVSKYFGIESHILDKDQVIQLLHPLIDRKTSDLTGGLYSPDDGFVDPSMYCNALVKAAKLKVFPNCQLISINTSETIGIAQQRKINSVRVKIDDKIEEIKTDILVNSTGVWAPFVAKLAGILFLQNNSSLVRGHSNSAHA